ncbi:PHP domain-containing protein [Christensenella tenuis]|uniref:PHP domain-containing protein n=1 Tax=Christensenella tenuis TaxID=2763033 RepID=A0ABR7EHM3_9FIRM|nr:PHP domain-containing protein [Christensenella tenuis]
MKYYQAETHCHTSEVSPCSRIPAQYLAQGYAEAGYHYMIVTDHYHPVVLENPALHGKSWAERIDFFWSGYEAADRAAQGTDLLVLPAMEVALNIREESGLGDDFLVYGFSKEFLKDEPYLYRLDYQSFYKKMKENGFLVFQAHPYRYGLHPIEPVCYDGIEMVNTHPRHFSRNALAIDFAAKHNLWVIGGSDAHGEEDIGRGGVMLPDGIANTQDFVQYYRENGSPELIVTFGA